MKICTFNIWNDDINFNKRLDLLIKEIDKKDLDIIALQEVKNEDIFNRIKMQTNFDFGYYYEGLAFLSNFHIKVHSTFSKNNNYMFRVIYNDISFTNVHLDWEKKESRLSSIELYFDMLEESIYEYEFILGDFNDTPEEKLHYELVATDFLDLHQIYAHSINELPLPTLDTINNPRWKNIDTDEMPSRFDWIMLNTNSTHKVNNVELIGTEEIEKITPSDHYGLIVDFDL